jgi:hypothetical protein
MMTSNVFPRYILSPLVTLALITAIEYGARSHNLTVSLALPVGALALCLFWSGLKANILSAVFITAYAFDSSNYDTGRFIQIALTAWPVAIGGGLLKRWLIETAQKAGRYQAEAEYQRLRAEENQAKADFVDNLNGNIEIAREINRELIELSNAIPALSKNDTLGIVNRIQGKAANLAQRVIGWHQLAIEKRELLKDE